MKYQMRQKLASVGDDSWIEDEHGARVYKVNGKAMRMRDTFVLEDSAGAEVAIERDGTKIAEVHKRLVGLRDRLKVDLDGGDGLTVKGKLTDHEYTIKGEHGTVAEISKKWFRVRDTYGIDIEPDQDDALIIAITVAVDSLSEVLD